MTAPAGSEQAIAANKFANANYTFQGWNTQADGKGMTYQKGDKLTLPEGTTVLYAQWKRIPGTLTWVKTDKDSGEVLAGSEWTLTPEGRPAGRHHRQRRTRPGQRRRRVQAHRPRLGRIRAHGDQGPRRP